MLHEGVFLMSCLQLEDSNREGGRLGRPRPREESLGNSRDYLFLRRRVLPRSTDSEYTTGGSFIF